MVHESRGPAMIHTITDMRRRIVRVEPERITRVVVLTCLVVALFDTLLNLFKFPRGDYHFKLFRREKSGWRVFIKI